MFLFLFLADVVLVVRVVRVVLVVLVVLASTFSHTPLKDWYYCQCLADV